jgi:hypothetical protein
MLNSVVYAEYCGWPAMLSVYVLISDRYAECRYIESRYVECRGAVMRMHLIMDILQLTGPNLGRVFNSRSGCMCSMMPFCCYEAKRSHLKLKTWPKQLLGSLPLASAVFVLTHRVTKL